MSDTLRFYRSGIRRQWRWRLTAANGERIGASTEGFVNRADCIANAARVLGIQPKTITEMEFTGREFARTDYLSVLMRVVIR